MERKSDLHSWFDDFFFSALKWLSGRLEVAYRVTCWRCLTRLQDLASAGVSRQMTSGGLPLTLSLPRHLVKELDLMNGLARIGSGFTYLCQLPLTENPENWLWTVVWLAVGEGEREWGWWGGGLRRSGEIVQPLERNTAHRIRHWNWGTMHSRG